MIVLLKNFKIDNAKRVQFGGENGLESVNIPNCPVPSYLRNVQIFGASTQASGSDLRNIINPANVQAQTLLGYGSLTTSYDYLQGTIEATGSAQGDGVQALKWGIYCEKTISEDGDYTISCIIPGDEYTIDAEIIRFYKNATIDESEISPSTHDSRSKTYTNCAVGDVIGVFIYKEIADDAGSTSLYFRMDYLQLEKSNTQSNFIPWNYHYPSPLYPSPVVSVPSSFDVRVRGSNMIDESTWATLEEYQGLMCLKSTGYYHTSTNVKIGNPATFQINLIEGKTYTIKANIHYTAYTRPLRFRKSVTEGGDTSTQSVGSFVNEGSFVQYNNTFVASGDWKYMFVDGGDTSSPVYIEPSTIMLYEGTGASYEPYYNSLTNITITDGTNQYILRALPDGTADRVYEENGMWKLEKNISILSLTGTENIWRLYQASGINQFYMPVAGVFHSPSVATPICTHFLSHYIADRTNSYNTVYTYIDGIAFNVHPDVAETIAEWETVLAEQVTIGNPVKIYYKLTTPQTITLQGMPKIIQPQSSLATVSAISDPQAKIKFKGVSYP